jgi:serine O-acetyltransferase
MGVEMAGQSRTREPVVLMDPLWHELRAEAEQALADEPGLATLIWATILSRSSLEEAIAYRFSTRLASPELPAELIRDLFARAVAGDPAIAAAMRQDLRAVRERDAACERFLEPVLHFKGFHAIQAHRVAHWTWNQGRRDLALLIQSRASEVFQTDIHPAARFGAGIFLDHATGLVVGETVVIEDDVSMLQNVTLGGTGHEHTDRHPKIRHSVLIGAGAKVLGHVEVGACSRVAAGSVVLQDVPECVTVAGVPARIVGSGGCDEPGRNMEQRLAEAAYQSFTYVI